MKITFLLNARFYGNYHKSQIVFVFGEFNVHLDLSFFVILTFLLVSAKTEKNQISVNE